MAFREVTVIQVNEALRHWLQGQGERSVARAAGTSRGAARRYITADGRTRPRPGRRRGAADRPADRPGV